MPDTTTDTQAQFKDLDFDIADDGTVTVNGDRSQATDQVTDTAADTNVTAQNTTDPYETRFRSLETKFDQVLNHLLNQSKPTTQEPDVNQQLENVEDPKQLVSIIKDVISRSVQNAIKPFEETQSKMAIQVQVNTLAAQHGQKFVEAIPAIAQLMESVPGLTVEKAFAALSAATPKTAQTPTKPTGNAADLVKKANLLKSNADTSVSNNTVNNRREIKTLKDAFMQALEDLS